MSSGCSIIVTERPCVVFAATEDKKKVSVLQHLITSNELGWSQWKENQRSPNSSQSGSDNVDVRDNTPVAKQQQLRMYWWSESDDWSWNVLLSFVILWCMMVTDSNSPAQSRVGEKQEISCAESEGQRLTPQIRTTLTKHSTQWVRKAGDIPQTETNDRAGS